jgi:hypothetical protein
MLSFGIKIYGVLSVLFFIYMFSFVVKFTDSFNILSMYSLAYLITALCWLVFGIGVLRRLPWARIGLIAIAGIYTIDFIEYPSQVLSAIRRHELTSIVRWSIGLIFFISVIIFFTRPRVKQQFINNSKKDGH